MLLLQLFCEYFKVGLFSVGGAMASIPFLYDMSDKTGWFTYAQLADMLAISESTPGPIGVNMATYVGFTTAGVVGSFVATLGVILPSLLIATIVAGALHRFRSNRWLDAAFYGLRPASAALIAAAGITVVQLSLLNLPLFHTTGLWTDLFQWKSLALAAVVLVMTNWIKPTKKWHPIVYIALSAVAGALFRFAGI